MNSSKEKTALDDWLTLIASETKVKRITQSGGKGSRKGNDYNKNYANKNGNNYQNGYGGRKGNKGRGNGRNGKDGNKNNGRRDCDDVSRCFKTLPGRKGTNNPSDVFPLAFTTDVIENNMRVSQTNINWINLALTGINVKVLEKCRDDASKCVPPGAERGINEVLLIEKGLRASVNDIVAQVKEMNVSLNIDPHAFRDDTKALDDPATMVQSLLRGQLQYGGTILRGVLLNENENFRDIIFSFTGQVAEAFLSTLTYSASDHLFSASYKTVGGQTFRVLFGIGIDSTALSPRLDKDDLSRELTLLNETDAAELARRELPSTSMQGASRSQSRKRSVSLKY